MVAGAAQNGSWRVVSNSGSVPVHALPFTNELVLFMQRGNNGNGTAYDSDLQVSLGQGLPVLGSSCIQRVHQFQPEAYAK